MKIKLKNYARQLWLSLLLLVGVAAIAVPGLNGTNTGNVAKVGNTEYATIEEAVAAWGPGKTLTLLDNVTTTSTVTVEVNATKSTQNWTLDLGNYTWTASGCNAFQLYAAGGTVMNQNYGLKIYANQNGGITASGKYCIECKYDNSTAGYRPRLEIHGGTYSGSNIIYYASLIWNSNSVSNGPSTHIFKSNDGTEPVFNGNFALAKCPLTIYAGYFNGTSFNTYPVSSTANTNLNGGHFKTISAFPSPNNNKGIIFGNYKVFVKSDASIDVVNGAPATYEAKATKTLLLSSNQGVNYSDYVYYEKANDALNKYSSGTIEIILSEGVTATQDKSFRSGTLTIDATAEGSAYTGNITLTSTSAKFIIKFPEGKGHYGVTASTGQLHVEETVADGFVTRTYSVQNVTDPEAKVGDTGYSTVYDAFYAIDGTTDNKTIVLQKDVTNAGIVTNGTAVNAAGKTVATFDLNGKSIGIGSVAAGNNADYTLTIIDSSQDKTGTVTNSDASLFILALTSINDYSGSYTLKIQAGTWQFDPSNVVINGETHNLVDEGYAAKDNGDGTWTVGEVEYVAKIGNKKYTTLQAAFNDAIDGDVVELLKDYDAAGEAMASGTRQFVINKSITFDGGGYTLTTKQRGIGVGNVNGDVTADIDVTIKNVTVLNASEAARCIDTRGKIGSLTLEGVTLSTDGAPSGYTQPLTIGGNQSDVANVTITNSTIQTNDDATAYYAIITFNPVNMTVTKSTIKGWANIDAKKADGSCAGSSGSVFNLDKCTLVSTNEYSGTSNAFGAFVIEDNNVTVNVTNSDIQINSTGDQWQTIVSDQGNTYTEGGVNLGDGNSIMLSGKSAFAYAGNSLAVSGGVSNVPVPEEFCAEGMIPTANTDSETMETYPYSVKVGQYVAQIGEGENVKKFETLEAAFAAAVDGNTVTLLTNVELTDRLFVNAGATPEYNGTDKRFATTTENKSITLDLSGYNVTTSSNIALAGGSLNIVNSGTADATHGVISTSASGLAPIEIRGTGDPTQKRTLTIGTGVTLSGAEYGLNVFGSNDAQKNVIEVNVNGTVEGTLFVLGNLSNTDNNIVVNVNSGASLKGKVGIALNGFATVNVADNTTIEGTDLGIEVRAGNLNVAGGTITSTATEYTVKSNGDGSAAKGAAISVAQHTTKLPISTNITGCTLSGVKTISVADPENGNLAGVTVKVADALANAETVIIPVAYEWVSDGTMSTLTPRDPVAKIGETVYYSLADAIAAVPANGTEATTITLLADVTENVAVSGGKNIVLDLGEKTLTGYIDLYDSELNVKNGNVAGTVYVNGGPASDEAGYNKFTLAADAAITADWGFILYQGPNGNDAYGSVIDINGTVNGTAWVMGNITEGNSVINVNSGAKIEGDVFGLNGLATLNVKEGATIIGAETGIEVRAGNLNVEGGTIKSTATKYEVKSNGNGTTTTGAAIAVAQHTTKLPINANILGGTLSGIKTISVTDPEGGNYEGVVVTAKDELTEKENNVIPDGYIWVSNNNGTSTLALTEETEMVLIDGETCPVKATATYKKVTYRRTFADNHKDKYQGWYVPFDYTIKNKDLENFNFYKIHLIAASAEESGEVTDISRIFIHIESVAEGYVLKANKPYFVVPKTTGTFEFTPEGEGVILYAPVSTSRLHLATSEFDYNFYGNYDAKMYATKPHDWLMMKGGQICWNTDATNWLPSYRWYIKVNANNSDADYSKIGFSIVDEDDATSIDSVHSMDNSDIEGYYTINGLKLEKPVKGINIIRYNNGKTKKVILK